MKVIDKGFEKITKDIERLSGTVVSVGIQPEDAGKVGESGTALVDYATYNVYGTDTIPKRDFMEGTDHAYQDKMVALQRSQLGAVIDGSKTAEQAANELGEWYQGAMQAHILNGDWVPNAPSTIKRKGHAQVLADAKLMYNNIKHKVLK